MSQSRKEKPSILWKSQKNKIYLNWCGAERIRADVITAEDKYRQWQHLYEDDPKGSIHTLNDAICASRGAISRLINSPQEKHIIFTTGSEESLKNVLFAHQIIPWGSRILATDCEFFGIYSKIAPPRYNTDIAKIWQKGAESDIIREIVNNIHEDTRLLLISHVCYNSGLELPIQKISVSVKDKNPHLLILVDGAQAVGQIGIDVQKAGCDFYAGDGHKWLVGPDQTGFLYICSPEHLKIIARDMCSAFAVHPDLNHNKGSRSGAIAFELAALAETLTPFTENDQLQIIQQHGRSLAMLFRHKLKEKMSHIFSIVPNSESTQLTSTVSIAFSNSEYTETHMKLIYDDLLAAGIHCALINKTPKEFVSQIQIPSLLRFCFHYWNTEEEVEIVISKLLLLAEKYNIA